MPKGILQIKPAHLKKIKQILKTTIPDHEDHEVRAFGSRVTGTAKPHSDLDLTIISKQTIPLGTIALLRQAFSESDLPFKVDIVDWASISPEFREIIEKDSVTL